MSPVLLAVSLPSIYLAGHPREGLSKRDLFITGAGVTRGGGGEGSAASRRTECTEWETLSLSRDPKTAISVACSCERLQV